MTDATAQAVAEFLQSLGADPHDPELHRTPERVRALWQGNLLSGEGVEPADILGRPLDASGEGEIILTHIPFHSVCPHHLLPYFGVVHLAYAPSGAIVGLGALERLITACSRRLILQETLTAKLVDALMDHLDARGAACAIEATHLCLILQGREPRAARVHTRLARGCFQGRADVLPPVNA